jgi:hypothetical protein
MKSNGLMDDGFAKFTILNLKRSSGKLYFYDKPKYQSAGVLS